MGKHDNYLMTVKTWNEGGEVVFYEGIARIYKKDEHFVLEVC